MNTWTRPRRTEERWHLEMVVTRNGLRVAYCGVNYPPSMTLETNVLGAAATLDACEVCYDAYHRSSRGHRKVN